MAGVGYVMELKILNMVSENHSRVSVVEFMCRIHECYDGNRQKESKC